jgi:hypothetical protein
LSPNKRDRISVRMDRKRAFIWHFGPFQQQGKTMQDTQPSQIRTKPIIVEKIKRRPVFTPVEAGTSAQQQPANFTNVKFPLCNAAVRKTEGSEWDLADAIVAECSETGEEGARNGSTAKMEAMREEIAKNHGADLSLERIRKLRKVASAFPPSRRRPGVSLEGHLEAGTPDALEALIKSAPRGTALTRANIRLLKRPNEKAEKDKQADERRRQIDEQRTALQNLCRQLEREKEQREERYVDLCRSMGKKPEPFSLPLAREDEPFLSVAEDLERALRRLLMSRGFAPAVLKQAIADFVTAVLAQQQ